MDVGRCVWVWGGGCGCGQVGVGMGRLGVGRWCDNHGEVSVGVGSLAAVRV